MKRQKQLWTRNHAGCKQRSRVACAWCFGYESTIPTAFHRLFCRPPASLRLLCTQKPQTRCFTQRQHPQRACGMFASRRAHVGGHSQALLTHQPGLPPSVPRVSRALQTRPGRAAASRVVAQQQAAAHHQAAAAGTSSKSIWDATASLWDGVFPKRQQQQQQLVRKVSAADLQSLLEAQAGCSVPLVVIFSATWCGPCKVMDARLQSLAKRLGPSAVQVVKLETDGPEEAQLATELKIHKLPTILFCGPAADSPAVRTQGLLPEQVLRDLIENKCQRLGADLRRSLVW